MYGRYVWKVKEGVETTNMPPWKNALTDNEIYQLVFYIQSFATPQDYNAKWGPQYSDPYARNLKINQASIGANPAAALTLLAAIVLWDKKFNRQKIYFKNGRHKKLTGLIGFGRVKL